MIGFSILQCRDIKQQEMTVIDLIHKFKGDEQHIVLMTAHIMFSHDNINLLHYNINLLISVTK
jgi:two-component SAPR family response regulator